MHLAVRFARIATGFAGRRARLQLRPQDCQVRLGLPRHDPGGRGADVGAAQVAADALDEVRDALFQAGVGA